MGKRLTAIVTRTGDDGTTGLGDGSRVKKNHLRVHAMGDIDELNACLGLLLTEPLSDDIHTELVKIQHDLFDLGGGLCIPNFDNLSVLQVNRIDALIKHYNADLPALNEFVLPGGCRAAALAHIARTVCRRAERSLVSLAEFEALPLSLPQYVNRLSDLLFVLSRTLNKHAMTGDVLWKPNLNKE